jgi:SAM-dependent methyltransferase
VWLSYDFIRSRNDSSICVTDLGTFSSEILPALWRGGFRHLAGLDLNPRLQEMPFSDRIDYRTENFLASSLGDASADIVTAISVIEHGFEPEALLREVARLLRPGGCFLASFDYWPEKIDTSTHRIFGMSWDILSRAQVEDLVSTAARHGLQPLGGMDFGAGEKVIRYDGFDYTFAWLALRKATTTPAAAT